MLARTPFVGAQCFGGDFPAYYESTRLVASGGAGRFTTSVVFRALDEGLGSFQTLAALGNGGSNAWSIAAGYGINVIQFRLQAWMSGAQVTASTRDVAVSGLWGRYIHLLVAWDLGTSFDANVYVNGQRISNVSLGVGPYSVPGGSRLRLGGNTGNIEYASSCAIQSFGYINAEVSDTDIQTYQAQSNLAGDLTDEGAAFAFDNLWSFRRSGLGGLPAVLPDTKETATTPVNGLARVRMPIRDVAAAEWVGYVGTPEGAV